MPHVANMMLTELPEHIQPFIRVFLEKGIEVWLIGSRANSKSKPSSDWDFLIFGDEDLLQELSKTSPPSDVDALIVFNGNNFKSPWHTSPDGVIKSGSLSVWNWVRASEDTATYEGTKLPNDWGTSRHALRVKI